jgi:protein O-GlcNAc transferase
VQVVGFGHPETSGLDSLDYFLSAASIEPDGAEAQYTERLVRLERLPSFYQMPAAPSSRSRTDLGLPENGTLYGCLHAPHAIHPEFDAILERIAAGDPDGRLILLEGPDAAWSAILRARWAKDFPVLAERAVFLPPPAPADFLALMPHLDLALDPIHAGGGTAFYELMAFGIPVVTWPGGFMRGRLAAGAYRQMGVPEAPVAVRLEDYAELALALGRDPQRRQDLSRALAAAAGRELFEDRPAVRALEEFLVAAVEAAGRGETLPSDCRPEA